MAEPTMSRPGALVPPPIGRSHVLRGRIDDVLEDALLDAALILVSAPAGSGKSVALSGWLDRRGSGAWYSLDADDNDPAVFWPAIATALGLESVDAFDARGVARALFAASTAVRVLVLDDYHFIANPTVHTGVDQLLVEAPAALRLVIATRHDPPLALSRLRSHSALREVRYDELRLAPDEVAAVLDATAGIALPEDHLARLAERTDGWAAAVQLVGISARDLDDPTSVVDAFSGDHRHVFDYFRDEVLDQLPADHRSFLMQTAILDRLTAPLCEAVTGRPHAQQMLRDLEERNLFLLPLDHRRQWFRYHHLFADWLRLQSDADPTRHRAAAAWLLANRHMGGALRHLIAGGDGARAADIVEDQRWALIGLGRWETLRDWIRQLPAELVRTRPGLTLASAWVAHHTGAWQDVHDLIGTIVTDDALMQAEIALLEAGRRAAIGDMHGALETARAGLLLVDASEPRARTGLLLVQGRGLLAVDNLDDAARSFDDAIDLARPYGLTIVLVIAESHLAEIARRRGDTADARTRAQRALATAEAGGLAGNPESAVAALTLAALLIDEGAANDARSLLDEAERLVALVPYVPREQHADAVRRRLEDGSVRRRSPGLVEHLTGRELSVLGLLPTSLTPRQIATELYLSHNTVKTHTRAIYRKLAVNTRHEAVEEARRLDLLGIHPRG